MYFDREAKRVIVYRFKQDHEGPVWAFRENSRKKAQKTQKLGLFTYRERHPH
jgi:hypothetical protein